MISEGKFREELYHRLNVVPIDVPSLEERRDDIPDFVSFFIDELHNQQGLPNREFSDESLVFLQSMNWPGNIRQLKNHVERILILGSEYGEINLSELTKSKPVTENEDIERQIGNINNLPLREARELFERDYLLTQINRFGGNISRTASFVGMERSALHRKLKSLEINARNKNTSEDSIANFSNIEK